MSMIKRFKRQVHHKGIIGAIRETFSYYYRFYPYNYMGYALRRITPGSFTYRGPFPECGENYWYKYTPYHLSWTTERTVEIPIIVALLDQWRLAAPKTLEVGNVLQHYYKTGPRDIVDKYEKAPGVINQDILDYVGFGEGYDVIVCISTLEHIGYDEQTFGEGTPDPEKLKAAVQKMKSLLAPRGILVCTFPMGENPELDRLVRNGALGFDQVDYLHRTGFDTWEQTPIQWNTQYNTPYPSGNGVVIAYAWK